MSLEKVIHATQSLEYEGQKYPYYGINLAISTQWRTSEIRNSVALRLTPFRVETTGEIIPLHEHAKPVVFSDAAKDPAITAALNAVIDAIQEYVTAKGL